MCVRSGRGGGAGLILSTCHVRKVCVGDHARKEGEARRKEEGGDAGWLPALAPCREERRHTPPWALMLAVGVAFLLLLIAGFAAWHVQPRPPHAALHLEREGTREGQFGYRL